ncbi:MAG: hypothetical protein CME68_11740 [Halobacteriovoraceae bacterium]|nr:hypothetical protein [Halobacteriovoraceae bacterium]
MNSNFKFIFTVFVLFFSLNGNAYLYRKGWSSKIGSKKLRYTVGASVMKTYFNASLNFSKVRPQKRSLDKKYDFKKELDFYYEQFKKSLSPKFLLFQADYYPFTNLGIYLKKKHHGFYSRFDLDKDKVWNMVEIIGTKYKVPYQFSFFLGNLEPYYVAEPKGVKKAKKGKRKRPSQSGSALSGLVLSFATDRLVKLDQYTNKWFNLSYKFKGNNRTKDTKKSWTLELGYLKNNNEIFYDGLSLYLKRDWASKNDPSLLANLIMEYRSIIPTNNQESLRGARKITTFQELTLGRNFTNFKLFGMKFKSLKIEGGMRWEVYKLSGNDSTEERNYYLIPSFSW